jgi:hypothetical protein
VVQARRNAAAASRARGESLIGSAGCRFGDFFQGHWRLLETVWSLQRRRKSLQTGAVRVRPRARAGEGWRGRGAPAHGADRGANPREWAARQAPLPLPGWLPRGGAKWRRCQLAGVARHVVKMPPTWRGSGCRDGKLAKDLAEFCGSCWAPGQFPDLLLDSTAPPPPSSSSPPTIILILDGASGWQRRSRCSG